MAHTTAVLIRDDDVSRIYRLGDGSIVTLTLDPILNCIEVTDSDGQGIGNMDVRVIDDEVRPPVHRITNVYMDRQGPIYLRKGIGRACVQFYSAYFGVVVTAAENDGLQQNDGSHLTHDGPLFIAAMRREGLVR